MVATLSRPRAREVTVPGADWNSFPIAPPPDPRPGVPFTRICAYQTAKRTQHIFAIILVFEEGDHQARADSFAECARSQGHVWAEIDDISHPDQPATRIAISTHDVMIFRELFLRAAGDADSIHADVRYYMPRKGDLHQPLLTPSQKIGLMPLEDPSAAREPKLRSNDLVYRPVATHSETVFNVYARYTGREALWMAFDYARWCANYPQVNIDLSEDKGGVTVTTYTHDPSLVLALFVPAMEIAWGLSMTVRWHKPLADTNR